MALTHILYGQAAQQGYHYFRQYPRDDLFLKSIITAMLIFDTVHAVVVTHICYETVVLQPLADISSLMDALWYYLGGIHSHFYHESLFSVYLISC
ncbi:hypothetical protein C8Q74DRAFT_749870 [Fomes fomentarius]|nr:hypothetical protein C8Q74DRAFT_749870 [Fomes fomentarius]